MRNVRFGAVQSAGPRLGRSAPRPCRLHARHTMSPLTDQRPRRESMVVPAGLSVLVLGVLAVVILRLSGTSLFARAGAGGFRINDLSRPLILGVACDLALIWSLRHHVRGRLAAVALLAVFAALAMVATVRRAGPTWPTADAALIELYTMSATRGEQLLGPYSRFRWHHPGPAMFYALVPL